MKLKVLFIFLFACVFLNAQNFRRLSVITPSGIKYVQVYDREGTLYYAVQSLADALSVDCSFSPSVEKEILDFPDYLLYVTSKNPFIILKDKSTKGVRIFQLPTSTYYYGNHLFVPLRYSLDILKLASGSEMTYLRPDKLEVKPGVYTGNSNIKNHIDHPGSYGITGLSMDEKANGTLVRLASNKRIPSYRSSFKNGVLTLIFRDVNADINSLDKSSGEGLVKWIKADNRGPDTEIKFGLNKQYTTSEVLNVDKSNDLLIALHNKIFENNVFKKKEKAKWEFNVIVIDPGHGGKDSGTIGIDGIKEKNVNLGIALKLGKEIEEKMPDIKVVYTRKTDKFVELYKRGQIANEANGNLFISIHCNATPRKPSSVEGAEVYLLRPGRTKEAISIAERENSVISYEDNPQRYQKLTDENFILVSMAQSAYMRYSEKFADLVNREFGKYTKIEPRGVKQAGFYVLVGASMPSVLVETGFLSNRRDAHYLNSRKGQRDVANAIFEAIKKFRAIYEKNIASE